MESSVFFDLKLRDFMSGGLQKVRAASASVFGGVGKDLTGVEKKTAAAATVMGRLRNALREMGSTASTESSKAARGMDDVARAATKAERSIRGMNRAQRDGGGGGGSIGGGGGGFLKTSGAMMLGSLAAQGVMMAAREVKEVVMSSLEKGMDAEQSIIGLQTFVGKSRARSIYTDLQKQAVMTPFTTADMLPVEMGLVATGMSPEKANKDMMNLMNAVSATGNAGNSFMFQSGFRMCNWSALTHYISSRAETMSCLSIIVIRRTLIAIAGIMRGIAYRTLSDCYNCWLR